MLKVEEEIVMVEPEVLQQRYQIPSEVLWNRLLSALRTVAGATVTEINADQREVRFVTGVSSTSWGENMSAKVDPADAGSELRITGQIKHTFLTTAWGERLHRQTFTRRLLALMNAAR